jgi:hypothetical protein
METTTPTRKSMMVTKPKQTSPLMALNQYVLATQASTITLATPPSQSMLKSQIKKRARKRIPKQLKRKVQEILQTLLQDVNSVMRSILSKEMQDMDTLPGTLMTRPGILVTCSTEARSS